MADVIAILFILTFLYQEYSIDMKYKKKGKKLVMHPRYKLKVEKDKKKEAKKNNYEQGKKRIL